MHGAANIRSAVKDKVRLWITSSYGFQDIQQLDDSMSNEKRQVNEGKKLANSITSTYQLHQSISPTRETVFLLRRTLPPFYSALNHVFRQPIRSRARQSPGRRRQSPNGRAHYRGIDRGHSFANRDVHKFVHRVHGSLQDTVYLSVLRRGAILSSTLQ